MLIDNGNEDDEKCFNNPTEYLKDEIMEEEKTLATQRRH
jgi:hypothetical protein